MNRRLPPRPNEWIDRSAPVEFRFEGETYRGFQGDVLTSALWANGVRLMGRSFKYHRPRSTYSMTGHDANVIVEDNNSTNIRGDLLPIEPGLDLHAINTAGGLRRDRYRITERFSRFLPVGFYYKAFHTPRRLFRFYEDRMRRMAGLGRLNLSARAAASAKAYAFCELLVVGAGPSGLAAAIDAAEAGADVLIVDEQAHPGGSLCWQNAATPSLRNELIERARALPNLRLLCGTRAVGWYADQWVALVDSQRLTKLRTQATLFATGCIEQPAVFQNNDSPGVLLGSAIQRLIHLFAVRPFDRAVVLACNDDGYQVALDLLDANVDVAAVVDLRHECEPSQLECQVSERGADVFRGHAIRAATPRPDANGLLAASISPLDHNGNVNQSSSKEIACDGLAVCVGWMSNSNLLSQASVRFRYAPGLEQLVPAALPEGVFVAGRVNGVYRLEDRLADGRHAGMAAVAYLDKGSEVPVAPPREIACMSHPYPIFDGGKKNFVDLDEDLHLADFLNAHQEGYDSIELLKRYSTFGMGPSQGKLSNMNAARILARLNGESLERTGTTTGRPFYHPVSIRHLAGRRFHPLRRTPLDAWHRRQGASMVRVGAWFRPEYYPSAGKSGAECALEEACRVRRNVGLIDLSTLTKLEVFGSDSARFLEQVYIGTFAGQKIGTTRYAVACDEAGIIAEDGLVARLGPDRFYITASTVGGEAFFREMQRLAVRHRMKVYLTNISGDRAAMNLAGPDARRVLSTVCDIDLDSAAFPAGGVRDGQVGGAVATILRSGFVGERSFEIHFAASKAGQVWQTLLDAGRTYGIQPFGIDAQRLLRLEKGHLIAGQDTDALTNPFEAQLDAFIKFDKPGFVGKRSLEIIRRKPVERLLVGFRLTPEHNGPFPEECQLVVERGEIVGRVTSIAPRSTLGYAIGLAFVRPELASPGTKITIRASDRVGVVAEVVELPFYDPQNERQK